MDGHVLVVLCLIDTGIRQKKLSEPDIQSKQSRKSNSKASRANCCLMYTTSGYQEKSNFQNLITGSNTEGIRSSNSLLIETAPPSEIPFHTNF